MRALAEPRAVANSASISACIILYIHLSTEENTVSGLQLVVHKRFVRRKFSGILVV
jgi:hypothetical protein